MSSFASLCWFSLMISYFIAVVGRTIWFKCVKLFVIARTQVVFETVQMLLWYNSSRIFGAYYFSYRCGSREEQSTSYSGLVATSINYTSSWVLVIDRLLPQIYS